jgi:hypothetical protein
MDFLQIVDELLILDVSLLLVRRAQNRRRVNGRDDIAAPRQTMIGGSYADAVCRAL